MIIGDDAHERALTRLEASATDRKAGLFGPGSAMWNISREGAVFLGGGRAALLQLAHPYVAEAIRAQSATPDDLAGRFQRTFDAMFQLVFGDVDTALTSARRIHRVHRQINGRFSEPAGRFTTSDRYNANDAEAMLWVQATLTDTSVKLYELMLGPLTNNEVEDFYRDTKRFSTLFGLPESVVPRDWAAFRAYFDGMVGSDMLGRGAATRTLSRFLMTPPRRRVTPLWRWYRTFSAGLVPAETRGHFDLTYGPSEARVYQASVRSLRPIYQRLPAQARYLPAYREALARIDGKPRPSRTRWVADRVFQSLLTQRLAS